MDIYKFIPVIGYEGLYEINALGIIKAVKKEHKLIETSIQHTGYYHVMLRKDRILKAFRFHRLVAKHFIPNPENKPEVNHIDGDKSNNKASNLEWCTPSENMRHAFKTGLRSHKGEKAPTAKLTNNEANLIRKIYAKGGIKQVDLGKYFGVSQTRISAIVLNQSFSL